MGFSEDGTRKQAGARWRGHTGCLALHDRSSKLQLKKLRHGLCGSSWSPKSRCQQRHALSEALRGGPCLLLPGLFWQLAILVLLGWQIGHHSLSSHISLEAARRNQATPSTLFSEFSSAKYSSSSLTWSTLHPAAHLSLACLPAPCPLPLSIYSKCHRPSNVQQRGPHLSLGPHQKVTWMLILPPTSSKGNLGLFLSSTSEFFEPPCITQF